MLHSILNLPALGVALGTAWICLLILNTDAGIILTPMFMALGVTCEAICTEAHQVR